MEQWSAPQRNTQLAACYAALGFPIRLEKQIDADSGYESSVFFIGEHTAPGFPKNKLSTVQQAYKDGTMETMFPMHPLLMGLRAMHNFNRLLDWTKQGKQQRLKAIANGQAMTYMEGTAHAPESVMVHTGDIDACAALATLGVPVCAIDGSGQSHRYHLPHLGQDIIGKHGAYNVDAAQLLKELRAGTLADFDDDFMAGYNALKARRQIMGAIYSTKATILIRKPNSVRRAYVQENASNKCMDRVKNHFKIV